MSQQWVPFFDAKGIQFYYNFSTGERMRRSPRASALPSEHSTPRDQRRRIFVSLRKCSTLLAMGNRTRLDKNHLSSVATVWLVSRVECAARMTRGSGALSSSARNICAFFVCAPPHETETRRTLFAIS